MGRRRSRAPISVDAVVWWQVVSEAPGYPGDDTSAGPGHVPGPQNPGYIHCYIHMELRLQKSEVVAKSLTPA